MDELLAAWKKQDWDAISEMFYIDGTLEIIATGDVLEGRQAISAHLERTSTGLESFEFKVRHLVLADDIVTFERDDVFVYNGFITTLPCIGLLRFTNGRIRYWREYFDGLAMGRALGMRQLT